MQIIAFIPARSGSKRIKNKNIFKINGKPLLVHVIEMLKKTNIFKSIVVSTDSSKIKKIALKSGASVPSLRKKSLSNDSATIMDVVKDYCLSIKSQKEKVVIFCIFPTSILIDKKLVKKAIKKYLEKKNDFLLCVKKFNHPIERSFTLNKNRIIEKKTLKNLLKNTQSFEKRYFDLGQFYIGSKENWIKKKQIFTNNTYCFDLSDYSIFDIDEPNDLNVVKTIFLKNLKNAEKK